MSRFRVTPRARDDLKNIGRYTERQWGKHQRSTYLKALEKRFGRLAKNPQLGKHRTDVAEGIDKLSYVPLHILDNLPCYSAATYFHDTKARIRSIR